MRDKSWAAWGVVALVAALLAGWWGQDLLHWYRLRPPAPPPVASQPPVQRPHRLGVVGDVVSVSATSLIIAPRREVRTDPDRDPPDAPAIVQFTLNEATSYLEARPATAADLRRQLAVAAFGTTDGDTLRAAKVVIYKPITGGRIDVVMPTLTLGIHAFGDFAERPATTRGPSWMRLVGVVSDTTPLTLRSLGQEVRIVVDRQTSFVKVADIGRDGLRAGRCCAIRAGAARPGATPEPTLPQTATHVLLLPVQSSSPAAGPQPTD